MTDPKTTRKGTLCARSWDDVWVARVNESESSHGRRICGARTILGIPCSLGSTHASGRCRFHGGFDLTGAPAGIIIGDLGNYGEPIRARLQYQDWGTPWTQVIGDVSQDTLLVYAREFIGY